MDAKNGRLDKAQWVERCAQRYITAAGMGRVDAELAAQACWDIDGADKEPEAAADDDIASCTED